MVPSGLADAHITSCSVGLHGLVCDNKPLQHYCQDMHGVDSLSYIVEDMLYLM